METVSHREMRNRSGEILRRVEAGESVRVTNNGRLSAVIVPPTGTVLDGLLARGEARAPVSGRDALLALDPVTVPSTSQQLIEDVRGRW